MKDIKGFEGLYAITRDGKLWSYRANKFLQLGTTKNGNWYLNANITYACRGYSFKMHRLVAIAFIPNPKNLREVNHKNGIKSDNRVENLEWCTSKENKSHARRSGLYLPTPRGEQNVASVYTEKIVKKIRKEYSAKDGFAKKSHVISFGKLAKKYGMSRSNVGMIISRGTWNHI